MASTVSSVSMPELPNLPGVRRDISQINPKLYREFKASQSQAEGIGYERPVATPHVAEENSLMSYFDGNALLEFSQILSPYPSASRAYNDLGGRYSLVSQQRDRLSKSRSLPYTDTKNLPSFITNEGRMCSFVAFFTEVHRDGVEDRSRQVIVKLFLEDSSIEIVEPRVENSGTTQGKFLKRHQVCKPNSSSIYTLADMHIGSQVVLYNRPYTIIDADESTRRYLREAGRPLDMALPTPSTVYDPKNRAGMSRAAKRAPVEESRNKAYFTYDTKVLRFYGVWDCRNMLFGDEINVKLHYSLAENTIEVVPINGRNSGRDRLPKLLKKTMIMKKPVPVEFDFDGFEGGGSLLGESLGEGSGEEKSLTEGRRTASPQSRTASPTHPLVPTKPYHWTDLKIGLEIPVASMTLLLIGADEFTREFYAMKNMPLDGPITRPQPEYPSLVTTIPPYNGFGSEEDSLQTCKQTLVMSAPSKDGLKLKMLAGMILRYEAILADPTAVDAQRKFIIQVHLEDDTFQIREPPIRNSGHKGGIFLRRCKLETHDGSKPLKPYDVYLGALVQILSHNFVVLNCDQFTFKFMEESATDWVYSHLPTLLTKIRPKQDVLRKLLLTTSALTSRTMAPADMAEVLKRAGLDVNTQEVYTLFRAVDLARTGVVKMTHFVKFVMEM